DTDDEFAEALVEVMWFVVPTVICCGLLVTTYFNCRSWITGLAIVQAGLAVTALAWFFLVRFAFGLPLLIGGKLAIAACLGLIGGAIWQWRAGFAPYYLVKASTVMVVCEEAAPVSNGRLPVRRRIRVGAS